jgi:subtilisin family serine protease
MMAFTRSAIRWGSAAAVAAALAPAPAAARGDLGEVAPVTVVTGSEIERMGSRSVADLLAKLPACPGGGAIRPPGANPAPGTLILLNGRRAPKGLNVGTIPADAVDRVEILRNDASAVYGAAACSGVVNLILDDEFPLAFWTPSHLLSDITGLASGTTLGLGFDSNVECDYGRGAANPPSVFVPTWSYGVPLISGDTWTYTDDPKALYPIEEVTMAWPYSWAGGEPLGPGVITPPPTSEPGPPTAPEPPSAPKAAAPSDSTPVWPKVFEGWRVPPWSMVQRSKECPEDLKAQLEPLYAARDQARADWVYFADHAHYAYQAPQDKAADQAKADEAQARRKQLDEQIRELLQKCVPGAAAGTKTAQAAPAPAPASHQKVQLNFGNSVKTSGGSWRWEPAPNVRFDLYPTDFGRFWPLPGDGAPRDTELGSGDPAFRRFTDSNGTIELSDEGRGHFDPTARLGFRYPDLGREVIQGDVRPTSKVPLLGDSMFRIRFGRQSLELGVDYEPRDQRVVGLETAYGPFGGAWGLPDDLRGSIPGPFKPTLRDAFDIGGKSYVTFNYKVSANLDLALLGNIAGYAYDENDECGAEAQPLEASGGGAGDAGWALERVGANAARKALPGDAAPIVVGIVDTGLDWNHADLAWSSLWRNEREIPGNLKDDDGNGYVDDVIGWDFVGQGNKPWDYDGHGTFVAGLVAATAGNGAGIDGINPRAKIMVLKALNGFGHTRASQVARAIVYGADNGAKILNLSLAGPGLPRVVQAAVDYATAKGVLVIAAAGNKAENIEKVQPAGLTGVLSVAATTRDDARAPFSNWGSAIDLAAPGVDVVSLRARRTDFIWSSPTGKYAPGSAFVGADKRLYRASGTSFAAPIVSGVASLVWSKAPQLTAVQVRRMLEQSARDVETPGRDRYTGYGLVDASAALAADPEFFVEAQVRSAKPAKDGGDTVVELIGTADADRFARARIELGEGEEPTSWKPVGAELAAPVRDAVLGRIPASELAGSKVWVVKLVVEHANGKTREARFLLKLG